MPTSRRRKGDERAPRGIPRDGLLLGEPRASFQIIQRRLVSMLADLTAMQLYCLQIGRPADPTVAGLAKMHSTRKARAITAEARDMLGGNGILLDYQVMRHMVDMEATVYQMVRPSDGR